MIALLEQALQAVAILELLVDYQHPAWADLRIAARTLGEAFQHLEAVDVP